MKSKSTATTTTIRHCCDNNPARGDQPNDRPPNESSKAGRKIHILTYTYLHTHAHMSLPAPPADQLAWMPVSATSTTAIEQ